MARGGPPEPKPKAPLRYRISPLDKQLDKLEGELEELQRLWSSGKVEDDTYDRMSNILETSRTKLIRKMRVAEGLPADEPLPDIVEIEHPAYRACRWDFKLTPAALNFLYMLAALKVLSCVL